MDEIDINVDSNGITLKGYYFIAWSRIDTLKKLGGWLNHLKNKAWFTEAWQSEFIQEIVDYIQTSTTEADLG
jgi:hypothetical protein